MKYTIEIGSGAIICIPASTKIGSGIKKLSGSDTHAQTQTASDRISVILFFQKKESRLNRCLKWNLTRATRLEFTDRPY
jgi:hypothetical protein